MKRITFTLLLCFSFFYSQAQFGLTGGVLNNDAENWVLLEDGLENNLPGNGYSIGIDYWFRLKNYRIEFSPEISYEKYEQSFPEIDLTFESSNSEIL